MIGVDVLNAEKAVLGALMAPHSDPASVLALAGPADFDDPKHEEIWRAIQTLVDAGEKPGGIAVASKLGNTAHALPGGAAYLHDLMQSAQSVHDAGYYAEHVAAAGRRRRIRTAALRIQQMCDNDDLNDVSELADRARGEMEAASGENAGQGLIKLADTLDAIFDVAQHGRPDGLSTGWDGIDRLIRGLHPGRLIVVGARPGVGKSIMGANLAHRVAHHHGRSALICTMEMDAVEIGQRIVSHHTSVLLKSLDTGEVSEASWERLANETPTLTDMGIYFDHRASQSLTSIRAAVGRMKRQRDDFALLVVDYIQLMQVRDGNRNRAEAVAELSRGLKEIAREFGIAVVALAQLNRESTKRQGGRPTIADLRDSGAIEQDADIVILLHIETLEDGTTGTSVDVLIEKNRIGPRGATRLEQYGHYGRLAETSWSPTRNI